MTRRRNIVPFGEQEEQVAEGEPATETYASEEATEWYEPDVPVRRNLGWIAPAVGVVALLAWTAFFGWANQSAIIARPTPAEWTVLLAQWSMPAAFVIALWLLAMRNSRVEATRFADAAANLRAESRALEDRLTHVNSELSIAREFIIAQGRDLEALGRIASERLSESAGKLERLIGDNSERVDRLETVSTAALENMEKLRGQLPVVTNATRDLTNTIGQAGQGASEQFDRLSEGFREIGSASEESTFKVDVMRERVNEVLGDFNRCADQLGQIATDRFAALDTESAALRERMEQQEIAALSAVRSRADELEGLLETTRAKLSETEGYALNALRERLRTVETAATDLTGKMREDEGAALAGWRNRIAGIEADARALFSQVDANSTEALDAAGARIAALSAEISRLHGDLRRQGETLDAEIEERYAKSEDVGRGLTERLTALVAGLDSEIEARRVRGAQASRALVEDLADTFAKMDSELEARTLRGEEIGQVYADKIAAALTRLDAEIDQRATRGEQRSQAVAARIASAIASLDTQIEERAQKGEATGQMLTRAIGQALENLDTDIEARAEKGRESASLMSESLRTALDALDSEIERRRNYSRNAARELAEGYADELAALDRQLEDRRNRHEAAGRELTESLQGLLIEFDRGFVERRQRHDNAMAALSRHAEQISAQLGEYGAKMETVAGHGRDAEAAIVAGLGNLSAKLEASREALSGTDSAVMQLTDSSVRLLELIEASSRHAREALPGAVGEAEERLENVGSRIEALQGALGDAGERGTALTQALDAARESTGAALGEIEKLHDTLRERGSEHADQLGELRATLSQARSDSEAMASAAEATLNGAIARLAEASREAVANIEGTSSDAVRSIAEKLATESGIVVTQALRESTSDALEGLDKAVSRATVAAREAATELRDQLGRVDEITGHLEARINAARQRAEEDIDEHFAKRVSQITESLNSTAIDIDKVLSAEVSEASWQAYLKGERGIFTRRAVRLIDSGEARRIVDHYEAEDEFREHVNRYIHDFEAMLRNLLATRDGNSLAVTMLSSDMGKLYVALAQAIERLRR